MGTTTTKTRSSRRAEESALASYLSDIQRYPLLTREEEADLGRRIREGDTAAREKLVRSNLRFVVSIAKRYAGNGVPLEDLVNDGNLGLIRAAERFDPERGYKFISYAVWWIRQAILHSLSETPRLVRLPMNRVSLAQHATRTARELEQSLGRAPGVDEIARELSVKPSEVEEVLTFSRTHMSLDARVGDEADDAAFVDQIEDEMSASPDEGVMADGLKRDLHRALETLTDRERTILNRYYGLDGKDPMTLEQIGGQLGYTRERIRQIKEVAIDKLRTRPQVRECAAYLIA